MKSRGSGGIASDLTIKSVGVKMGFSAIAQGVINKGKINVIGVLGDGFLGYGSSSIIGSGLQFNINILKEEVSFEYLGNGIGEQEFLFNSTLGAAFGGSTSSLNNLMKKGPDGVKSSYLRELILGPRQFGNYGISKAYEKESR
ncbi:MAG TPA: hypothetical protein VKX29_01555 [Brumimicrobium sp.]|nr:hypothetical protein [Brumimicrobium sp.]